MARSYFLLVEIRVAATVIGQGIPRIEPDRLVVFGDSAVIVALVAVRVGAAVVGGGVVGVEADRFVVVGNGAVVVALGAVAVAAVVVGNGQVLRGFLPGTDHAGASLDLHVGGSFLLVHAPGPRLG